MSTKNKNTLALFVSQRRKQLNITQETCAEKAGVGLRFLRELENNKATLRLDKINDVLALFGHELKPQPIDRSDYE
jgi:y4mF family transcriptional regulator